MRRSLRALALGVCAGLAACAPQPGPGAAPVAPGTPRAAPAVFTLPELPADARPGLLLLVSIAGLPPHAYRAGAGEPPWMPNLAALAAAGAAADGLVPVAGAASASAHATLITGRTPAVHGVGADHPLGPRGVEAEHQRRAEGIAAPALWSAARAAGIAVASLGWPSSAGAPVDWLFPELFPARPGESSPGILEGEATPLLLASARRLGAEEPEAGFPGPARDAILTSLACELVAGPTPPRLLLLRLSQSEPVLRLDGPDSEPARRAFASADAELGRLLGCLEGAGRLAESAWFVTGDAAVLPVHTQIQPNVALEAAGLLVPSPGSRSGIGRWDALARSNGVSAFVYARDAETAILARRALGEAAARSHAFRVVPAQELLALGVDREAWFGLEAEPGFAFGDTLRGGLLLVPSTAKGAAGSLGRAPERRVGFVAWGRGIRSALRIPELGQTDVAPTLAYLLGVELPEGEGRPLVGALGVLPPAVGAGAR